MMTPRENFSEQVCMVLKNFEVVSLALRPQKIFYKSLVFNFLISFFWCNRINYRRNNIVLVQS